MNVKDNRLRARPVPTDNFTRDFKTIANTKGAPKPPDESDVGPGKTISDPNKAFAKIEEMLTEVRDKNGIACAAVSILTHHRLISLLASCRSIVLVDKFSPKKPLVRLYNQINAGILRNNMPGNVFPHLELDAYNDRGVIEGVRMVGKFKETVKLRENETRPNMHEKTLVTLLPQKKILKPAKAITSASMNWSYNSLNSFESIDYSEDLARADHVFQRFGYYWSLSEGLYDFCGSITPRFTWKKVPVKYNLMPKCPECGKKEFAPYWWQTNDMRYPIRKLRCIECNETIEYP